MSFEMRPTDLPYEGEQMRKTLRRMQSALNYADCCRDEGNWRIADRAWFTPEAHANEAEEFGIEVRMEVCGIGHDGKEVEQLIDVLESTAARLRSYLEERSAQVAALRDRVRVVETQFAEIDIAEICNVHSQPSRPVTAPAGAN